MNADQLVVDYWFGAWAVIGLGVYSILRWLSGRQPAACGMLATLVVICGVNYNAYAAASSKQASTHISGRPAESTGLPV